MESNPMEDEMTFDEYKTERDHLHFVLFVLTEQLKSFPRNRMGLTPDSVKADPAYKKKKGDYNKAFQALRKLNGANIKRFKRELRKERDAKRTAA